tara:strand:- start:16 stop:387 length:372 start_codon:yes stop_codon:yes gene_type:complete
MCLLFDSTSLIVSFVFLLRTCECCTQIDLSDNVLCGINKYGQGNYNADGIKAIAHAVSVSASLTSINLKCNDIVPESAKHIAEGISVSASLRTADLRHNCFDFSAKEELRYAVRHRAFFQLDV